MAKNLKFWKKYLTTSEDLKAEQQQDVDALEQGLEGLTWQDGAKRAARAVKKTPATLGEEIGNSVTHAVMAVFFLGMIPYAAIRAFTHAPEGKGALDAVGISIYMITSFLMFLASTWYHSTLRGTTQKYVTGKLDHCMVFTCIAGTYTPIWLSLIGGVAGIVFCIVQWCLVLAGILFKSLMYSKSKASKIISWTVYMLLVWIIIFYVAGFYHAASLPCFWLVLAGTICYTVGLIFFAGKYKFAHMVWHFLVDFGAVCHFIGIVFFLR